MSKHDSMCPWPDSGDVAHCDPCGLIAKVRADERGIALHGLHVAKMAEGIEYERGYRDGMLRAATMVTAYADETHPAHDPSMVCQRCDIAAGVRLAAFHVTKAATP